VLAKWHVYESSYVFKQAFHVISFFFMESDEILCFFMKSDEIFLVLKSGMLNLRCFQVKNKVFEKKVFSKSF
jgi:hypothetical protein